MAYTQAQLESKITALESALASGVLRVDFADRSTTYRSVTEIQDALSYFQRLLTNTLGTSRPKQSFAVTSKGLA